MDALMPAATRLARQLLDTPGLHRRWAHVQAVAACAAELSATVAADDRELLVAAAWLHDIGYAPPLAETGFHPIDGGRYLTRHGWPRRLAGLVAHHSGAVFEAAERGLAADLDAFDAEHDAVADALAAADLTTGPDGQRFTFEQRLDEILARYGPDTSVHRAMRRARPALAAQVAGVLGRLPDSEVGSPVSDAGA